MLPGQIPTEGDTVKVWLRKCVAVAPNEAESSIPGLRCVFADAMGPPVLATPEHLLPICNPGAASGFIVRPMTLTVPSMTAPPPQYRRNLNAWALAKLQTYDCKALKEGVAPHFENMAIAFLQNLRALPKEVLKGGSGAIIQSVQKVAEMYSKHEKLNVAAEAKALLT